MSVHDLVALLEDENKDPRVRVFGFAISDVEVEERVRLKCMIPPCPNYGRNKFCPPNLPEIDFIRKALSKYQGGVLVVLTIPCTEETMSEVRRFKPQNELMKIISAFEKIACEKINHLAFGLTVGGCKLCAECPPPRGTVPEAAGGAPRNNRFRHRCNNPGQEVGRTCSMARRDRTQLYGHGVCLKPGQN